MMRSLHVCLCVCVLYVLYVVAYFGVLNQDRQTALYHAENSDLTNAVNLLFGECDIDMDSITEVNDAKSLFIWFHGFLWQEYLLNCTFVWGICGLDCLLLFA